MIDIILSVLSQFFGSAGASLVLYGGAVLAVVGSYLGVYVKGRSDRKKKEEIENLKSRLKTVDSMKEKNHDAEIQSDETLTDRLTRGR